MAGAWAESGSLPSTYFEVFEWTEVRALPPNYKLNRSKPPALQPIMYIPRLSFLPEGPLLTLSPRTARLHASLNSRHPHPSLHKDPRASLTFRPPPLPLLGTQPPPQGPLPYTSA